MMAVVGIGRRWSITAGMMVVLITVVMVVVVEILAVQKDKCHRDKYPYHGLSWAINVLSVNAESRRQDNSHISWAGMSQSQHTTRDNSSTNVSGTSIHGTSNSTGSGCNSESSDVRDGGAGDNRGNSHCEMIMMMVMVARMVMMVRMVIKQFQWEWWWRQGWWHWWWLWK